MADHADPKPGLGDRLERKVVFRFSAALLRFLAGLATLVAVAGAIAIVHFSVPPTEPVPPPDPAKPALPPKPTVTMADVKAMQESGPVAPERPGKAASPSRKREREPEQKVESPEAAALTAHLEKYRPLADQLGIPWESVRSTVCERGYYNICYERRTVITRAGMKDLLAVNLFKDFEDASDRDAMLTGAERLFALVGADAAGPGDVFALKAPPKRVAPVGRKKRGAPEPPPPTPPEKNGPELFREQFLSNGKALRVAFQRIHASTPEYLPQELRLSWNDVLSGALAIAREGGATPVERGQAVEAYAKAIVAKEEKRLANGAGLMAEYRKQVEARERKIRSDQAAYEVDRALKQANRMLSLYAVGAAASAIISLSVLLALLAIERHLRAMRDLATAPAATREGEGPPQGPSDT